MATAKPPISKPAPSKPSAPVASTPAKPGGPAKPGTPSPAKPSATPATPAIDAVIVEESTAATPAKPAPAATAEADGLLQLAKRIDSAIAIATGYEAFVTVKDGVVTLNIDEAPPTLCSEWAFIFGCPEEAIFDDAASRKWLLSERAAKRPFAQKRTQAELVAALVLTELQAEQTEEEAPVDAEPKAEEGEQSITEEDIAKADWKQLTAWAKEAGVEFSDIAKPPQPKVLRQRLLEALSGGEEEAPDELELDSTVTLTTEDGSTFEAVYKGTDSENEGNVIIAFGDDLQSWPADAVTAA